MIIKHFLNEISKNIFKQGMLSWLSLRHWLTFATRFQTFSSGLVVHIWLESNIINMICYAGEIVLTTYIHGHMIDFFSFKFFVLF